MTGRVDPQRDRQLALLGGVTCEVLRELTDPLTAILSHAELLCDPDRPVAELQESVGSIVSEALRCRRILGLAGTLGQGATLVRQPLDVEALAADVALAVAARRRPEDPQVRFQSLGGAHWVVADRAVLSEVLAGLVEACVDERLTLGDGGAVEVVSRGHGDGVELAIQHDLSRQAATTALPDQSLMARVAAVLVELMGGTLELRGDRQSGARILVHLPGMQPPGNFPQAANPGLQAAPGTAGG